MKNQRFNAVSLRAPARVAPRLNHTTAERDTQGDVAWMNKKLSLVLAAINDPTGMSPGGGDHDSTAGLPGGPAGPWGSFMGESRTLLGGQIDERDWNDPQDQGPDTINQAR